MNLNSFLKQEIFNTVSKAADELEYPTFVIGGFVRDAIMERNQPKDIDIVCLGSVLFNCYLGLTQYNLQNVMDGDIDKFIEELQIAENAERLLEGTTNES